MIPSGPTTRPTTRGARRFAAAKPMDANRLLSYSSPLDDCDSATEGSAPVTASSSPASRLTNVQVVSGSLPQSPDLWADFMYSDYPYHPTTACDLLPPTLSPHGGVIDQTPVDQLSFGLDPLIVPQTTLPDFDLFAEELNPAMPENSFAPTPTMASMLSLDISHILSSSSPRSNPRGSQPTLARSSGARRRGRSSSAAEESGADDGSLSPGLEEERLQERRHRNKLASRKLRQKHLDHVSDLESRLGVVTQERDELRLRIAKWEGEVIVLRKLLENRAND